MRLVAKLVTGVAFGVAMCVAGAAQADPCSVSSDPGKGKTAYALSCSSLTPNFISTNVLNAVKADLLTIVSEYWTKNLSWLKADALKAETKGGTDVISETLGGAFDSSTDKVTRSNVSFGGYSAPKFSNGHGAVKLTLDFNIKVNAKHQVTKVTADNFDISDLITYYVTTGKNLNKILQAKHGDLSISRTINLPTHISVPGPIAGAGVPALAIVGAFIGLRRRKAQRNA